MALLALTRGQLLVNIFKMYKQADMLSLYDKKFLKYSTEDLLSEYINIEKILEYKVKQEFKEIYPNDIYNESTSSDDEHSNFMKNAIIKNPNKLKI